MTKAVNYISLCIILLAGIAFAGTQRTIALPAGSPKLVFPWFPVGATHTVVLDVSNELDENASAASQAHEKSDQMRDWCLLSLLEASNQPIDTLGLATHDLPPIRHPWLSAFTTFEYGKLRSRVIADGAVVALLPNEKAPDDSPDDVEAERRMLIGQVADEQRKNLGFRPKLLHVFEYELANDSTSAQITRLPDVTGEAAFSAEYGFHELPLRTRADLQRFVSTVDRLTYISDEGGRQFVGGRSVLGKRSDDSARSARIGVEEIATLWRAQHGLEEYRGVGFSLDPVIDVARMARDFELTYAPTLSQLGAEPMQIDLVRGLLRQATPKDPQKRTDQIDAVLAALRSACATARDAMRCDRQLSGHAFQGSYQQARYEGRGLAGTEVGMVLFYTDLLMKLYAMDFDGCAPRALKGFPILPDLPVSTAFRADFEHPTGGRLWLSPLQSGYQVAEKDGSAIVFGPLATRVSAARHSILRRQDLGRPVDVLTKTFVDWVNANYRDLATHDPQFRRLDEIMKWGVAFSWLDNRQHLSAFAFLGEQANPPVQVTRTHRFPIWATTPGNTPSFRNWDQLNFDAPESARAENESFALLHSRPGTTWVWSGIWSGGVAIDTSADVALRTRLTNGLENINPAGRRSNFDIPHSEVGSEFGRVQLRRLDNTTHTFDKISSDVVTQLARSPSNARITGPLGEVGHVDLRTVISRRTDGLSIQARVEQARGTGLKAEFGELRVTRTAGDYHVSWNPREMDAGHRIAVRMSEARGDASVLLEQKNVDQVIYVDRPGAVRGHVVKLRGSDTWVKISPADPRARSIAPGAQARVAGYGENAQVMDVSWMGDVGVRTELGIKGYVKLPPENKGGILRCCTETLPTDVQMMPVRVENSTVTTYLAQDGTRFVKAADLPPSAISEKGWWSGRFSPFGNEERSLAHSLKQGDYRAVARSIAEDPAAYQARVKTLIDRELREVPEGLGSKDIDSAAARVRGIADTYGTAPEVRLARAQLKLHSGDIEGAAAEMNQVPSSLSDASNSFLQTLEAFSVLRPRGSSLNQRVLARWANWKSASPAPGTKVSVRVVRERLGLELELENAPEARTLSRSEAHEVLSQPDDPVYIEDHPAIQNLDVTPDGISRSLHQLVDLGQVRVEEGAFSGAAHLRPDVIRTATGTSSDISYSALWLANGGALGQEDEDETEEDPQDAFEAMSNALSTYIVRVND